MRLTKGNMNKMNKPVLATLLLLSTSLAACGQEDVSCSNPNVQAKLIQLVKTYMDQKANSTMNIIMSMVGKGGMTLQSVRTDEKKNNVIVCEADISVKVDPNFVKETQSAVKANPILPAQYTVTPTDDGSGFYIKLLHIDL